MICIPGIPIKRNSVCIDPTQSPITHVVEAYKITEEGDIISLGYKPNYEDYPEYSYVIQMFIDQNLKEKKDVRTDK